MIDISITTSLNIARPNQSSEQASQSTKKAAESGAKLPVGGNDEPPKPKPQEVQKAAQQIQDFISKSQRQLEFRVHEQSGRTIITVINPQTQEIIRQIPGEEVLNIAAALEQSGLKLFDDTE